MTIAKSLLFLYSLAMQLLVRLVVVMERESKSLLQSSRAISRR